MGNHPDSHRKLVIHCDGASRGNPGPAGAGAIVKDEQGATIRQVYKFLGHATNNQAEYAALILGIEEAQKLAARDVEFRLDSELVVLQLNGQYKVKNAGLRPFFQRAMELLNGFERYSIKHVPRSMNRDADELANRAIDGHAPL